LSRPQRVSLRVDTSRCPRTHSGRDWCPSHGRCAPSAVSRTATDGPRRRRIPGLTRAAEPGVHPEVPAGGSGWFLGTRAGGEGGCADGQGGGAGERDGARAGGACPGGPGVHAGVLGPEHPCGDDALLVSELISNSIRHSGPGVSGRTVTAVVRTASGVVRVEVIDRGGSGCRGCDLVMVRRKMGGCWCWWRGWPRGGAGGGRMVTWFEVRRG
jgi:hypothetical protein